MEHSWIGNEFVGVVEDLIAEGGAWHGDRIVWAGDYADPETPEVLDPTNENRPMNLFAIVGENKIRPAVSKNKYRFVLNLDTKEFVDKNKVPNVNGWQIHPLPLLTCCGNGRGGGDYHNETNSDLVGKWNRNRVIVQNGYPKGFKELIFDLIE
jgi:hypothetical protein